MDKARPTEQSELDASGLRFGIACARWNAHVTDRLLDGAIQSLRGHGAAAEDLIVVSVPGAFEVPQALDALVASGRTFHGLIGLACLVRGETAHFDYLCEAVTHALMRLSTRRGLPVAHGVLTCNTMEQAVERAGGRVGNKGTEAAEAALEMARLYERLGRSAAAKER